MATSFIKAPSSVLDYQWDWSNWLEQGDFIVSHVIVGGGLTVDSSSNTTTAVTAWISGGTANTLYEVSCSITTDDGRVDSRVMYIMVMKT